MTLQLTKEVVEYLINDNDVVVSNTNDVEEYKECLRQFDLCTEKWISEFLAEIEWAKVHIEEPLAKTWGVDIPSQYKVKKEYCYTEPMLSQTPTPRRVTMEDIDRAVRIEDEGGEPPEEEEEEHGDPL
jgi:hypothetical protein